MGITYISTLQNFPRAVAIFSRGQKKDPVHSELYYLS